MDLEPSVFERSFFRIGSMVIIVATIIIVAVTNIDLENILVLVFIVTSLVIVRGSGVEIPFLIAITLILVTSSYAALFIKSNAVNLPGYYSKIIGSVDVLWLFFYFPCAALGARCAGAFVKKKTKNIKLLFSSQFSFPILISFWLFSLLIGILLYDLSNGGLTSIIHYILIPVLSIALIVRLPHAWSKLIVVIMSLMVCIPTGTRGLFAEFLLAFLFVFILATRHSVKLERYAIPLLVGSVLLGIGTFYGMTFVKYGEYPSGQTFGRLMLIETHAGLKLKEFADSHSRNSYEKDTDNYWLSLVPFVDKNINAGHYTYELARDKSINRNHTPYLPPPIQAELYFTGGWTVLVIGSFAHGFFLCCAWLYAIRFKKAPLQFAAFVVMTVMLIGLGGGADLYGRLAETKRVIFILFVLWMISAFLNGGVAMRYLKSNRTRMTR